MPGSRPLVVPAPRELDAATAPAFRDELGLFVTSGVAEIVVDMSGVTFLDSSGMGALVAVQRVAAERCVRVTLRGVRPNVHAALRVAGLVDVLLAPDEPPVQS